MALDSSLNARLLYPQPTAHHAKACIHHKEPQVLYAHTLCTSHQPLPLTNRPAPCRHLVQPNSKQNKLKEGDNGQYLQLRKRRGARGCRGKERERGGGGRKGERMKEVRKRERGRERDNERREGEREDNERRKGEE